MAEITLMEGIAPALRDYLERMNKAMSGDVIITIDTANDTPAPTSAAWTKTVYFRITDALGNTHDWYSGDLTASIADTSSAGTATIDDATPAVVNGEGKVVISGDAAAWLNEETVTLTLSPSNNKEIMGKALAAAAFTRTFTTA